MIPRNLTLQRDIERMAETKAQIEIATKAGTRVSASDAESLATYVLYGKDENGKNAFQRGECFDATKRYSTQKTKNDTLASLDALAEALPDGLSSAAIAPLTAPRTTGHRENPIVRNAAHAAIPGMAELWRAIDHIRHQIDLLEGKVAPTDDETAYLVAHSLDHDRTVYHLRHLAISKMEEQYTLRDAYMPHMPPHYAPAGSQSPTLDWSSDSSYIVPADQWPDFCESPTIRYGGRQMARKVATCPRTSTGDYIWTVQPHTFSYENPRHWRFLLHHAFAIRAELGERPETWGRALIFDLERYLGELALPDDRIVMLRELFADHTLAQTVDAVAEECGKIYSQNHISVILNNEIPKKLATHVIKQRLVAETQDMADCIVCEHCGMALPRHPLFFNYATDGSFTHVCTDCKKKRGKENDERRKNVCKMQTKKINRQLFED